ncbi:hypothetical protein KC909_04330 [Candidatus Dojkabacteria bacterium]|uniref:Uncharacterized protein n=1 Tax=Candidatus Dojkabacteria bacterium TaxID=2099670 RepID=A0A955L5T0_9BACT|nr:hypothetical protein [Candidatus Dojkabacteria bacterium]
MKKIILLLTFATIGITLRLLFANYGHNYDYESFMIVADLVDKGKNVYANTPRYNYGPIWFLILHVLDLATNSEHMFRMLLALLLSVVDCAIAYILFLKYGYKAGILYLLNPISIIVTGFISQFDNLAVLTALLSMLLFGNNSEGKITYKNYLGLLLLGLSLSIKHVFFFFPFWLALKQKGKKRKLLSLVIPLGIFFIAFIPFLSGGGLDGIWENIFRYSSVKNAPLLNFFLPNSLVSTGLANLLLILSLCLAGLYFYKRDVIDQLGIYSLVLVIFSPAIIHNHLVIAVLGISIFPNVFFLVFTILTSYIFTLDRLGLGIQKLIDTAPKHFLFKYSSVNIFGIPILLLFLGFLYMNRHQWHAFKNFRHWLREVFEEQRSELTI